MIATKTQACSLGYRMLPCQGKNAADFKPLNYYQFILGIAAVTNVFRKLSV
jgi:hypothetical protein